jgi:hypothetical protein
MEAMEPAGGVPASSHGLSDPSAIAHVHGFE